MKVLFYGGCHANIFKRAFDRYAEGEYEFESLINHTLISSGTPFPYERLNQYGLIVFSPIRNKSAWNTAHLEEACSCLRVKCIKYPFLQWSGYWPMQQRRMWGNKHIESASHLLERLSEKYKSFDEFYEKLFDREIFREIEESWLKSSIQKIREYEAVTKVDISIADYIYNNFSNIQLFLTPTHPSTHFYSYIVSQIAQMGGIKLDPALFYTSHEFQAGVRTPIIPGIADLLGLKFKSSQWINGAFLPGSYSFREYAMSFHSEKKVSLVVASAPTQLASIQDLNAGAPILAKKNTKHLILESPGHETEEAFVGTIMGEESRRNQALLFQKHDWTRLNASWDLLAPAI